MVKSLSIERKLLNPLPLFINDMMEKERLLRIVETIFKGTGFKVARMEFKGSCFDLVASRLFLLLFVKVLQNIDSFTEEQAEDLKRLAKLFGASPLIVGLKSKNEELEEGVVYERHGIYALNPQTLYDILVENELPAIFAERGGFYVRVNGEYLRELRERHGYSVGELAELLGVSRKSLQNYEKGEQAMSLEVALRLEELFDAPVAKPIDVLNARVEAKMEVEPETDLEREVFKRLEEFGMGVIKIKKAPFDAISKEGGVKILTGISERKTLSTVKRAQIVDEVSKIIQSDGLFILERTKTEVVGEIPLIPKEKLNEIKDADELIEMIEELKKEIKRKIFS
jgi:putative transcriptional regulator